EADLKIGLNVKKDNPGAISDQEITKRTGARDEAKGGVEKAKAAIEEAKGSISQAEASLEQAQLNYDWCKVTAPIAGRTNRHLIDVGNVVSKDVTILTNMVSIKPIWAYIDVDQNRAREYQKQVAKGEVKSFETNNIPMTMGLAGDLGFTIQGAT